MYTKNFLLACVLSITTFSFDAFSEESKFCSNPLKTICQDTKIQSDINGQSIRRLRKQISDEANKNAEPLIKNLEKQYTDSWHKNDRELLRNKILNQEIMKSAKSRIKGLEKLVTNMKSVSAIKIYMKKAIDESPFNNRTRKVFKKTIDSVMIGNFSDYSMRIGTKEDFMKHKTTPCGADGMDVNAIALKFNNQRYILICPGTLINYSQITNEQERLRSILFVVSHEMGHHLESAIGDDVESLHPYVNCLIENYSKEFTPSKADSKFCQKLPKNSIDCKIQVTVTHSSEMIADQWAIQTLAIYARENKLSVTQFDSLLRNNFAFICGEIDDGEHPSGDFRIKSLLRINPEISDYLSCNNSKIKKHACTFEGTFEM